MSTSPQEDGWSANEWSWSLYSLYAIDRHRINQRLVCRQLSTRSQRSVENDERNCGVEGKERREVSVKCWPASFVIMPLKFDAFEMTVTRIRRCSSCSSYCSSSATHGAAAPWAEWVSCWRRRPLCSAYISALAVAAGLSRGHVAILLREGRRQHSGRRLA